MVKVTDLGASAVKCYQPVGNLGISEINQVENLPKTCINDSKSNIAGDDNSNENLLHHNTGKNKRSEKSTDNEMFTPDFKLNNSAITSSLNKNNLQLISNILTAVNIGLIIRLCYSPQGKINCYRDEKGIVKALSDRFHYNHQCLMFAGAS